MRGVYFEDKNLGIRFASCQVIFDREIEPQLTEDVIKYGLEKNNRLKRQFIVYRVASFFTDSLSNSINVKTVFLLPTKIISQHFSGEDIFIYNSFRNIFNILSINFLNTDLSQADFQNILGKNTGESKELKVRITNNLYKRGTPNLTKLYSYLKKYKIHKLQEDISQNIKIKLGLFVA